MSDGARSTRNESLDYCNEFAILHEKGFTRLEGPYELSHGGTNHAIHVPEDDRLSSLVEGHEGDGAAIVADGEIVHGGLVKSVHREEGHVVVTVDQYADGEVGPMSDSENESGDPKNPVPDGWPEHFGDPAADCPHHFHWDDHDGLYRCIYCDNTRDEPRGAGDE